MGKFYSLGIETEQTEFKKSTAELKDAIISIVAILNKSGSGDLYFGVKDNGDVIGQDISSSTLRDVSRAVRDHIKPTIYPVVEEQEYEGRKVVHVSFQGQNAPYLAYDIPRIRIADEDVVMTQDVYNEMLRNRDDSMQSWERHISKYSVSDIDMETFNKYLKRAKEAGRITFEHEDPASVLNKLELAVEDKLLNAGAALFVDCGINEIGVAKFATDERLTFIDQNRMLGPIPKLIDYAENYVRQGMDWRVEFGGRSRIEIPEVPVDALREAITNAFAHRQIELGQSVELLIFKTKIEINSHGAFPKDKTPEMFISGSLAPVRRNELISRTLYYSKDMESFATGLKRIKDSCDAAGVEVEFIKPDSSTFKVLFHRHCGEGWGWAGNRASLGDNDAQNVAQNDAQNVAAKNLDELIIRLIKEDNTITREKIAAIVGVSKKTVERHLGKIDSIKYVGSSKNGHWEITRND